MHQTLPCAEHPRFPHILPPRGRSRVPGRRGWGVPGVQTPPARGRMSAAKSRFPVTGAWDEGQVSLGDAELAGQPC